MHHLDSLLSRFSLQVKMLFQIVTYCTIYHQARSYLYAKYTAAYTLSPDVDLLKCSNIQ